MSTTSVLLRDGSTIKVEQDDHGVWVLPPRQRVSPTPLLMKVDTKFVCYAPGEIYDGMLIGLVKENN